MVGAPGYDPGRLQQSAAPVYKTELHTSADAVLLMRAILSSSHTNGRSGWILTSAPHVPNVMLYQAEPHSDELARCMGIKPISTARQAVCLVRCIAAQLVRLAGLEPALHGLSNRSLYRLGYRRVEDAPGNDPGPDRLRAGRSAN